MPRRKHTACSQCGYKQKTTYLEVQWRKDFSGPWHYAGGWWCVPCRDAFIRFIGWADVQLAWD